MHVRTYTPAHHCQYYCTCCTTMHPIPPTHICNLPAGGLQHYWLRPCSPCLQCEVVHRRQLASGACSGQEWSKGCSSEEDRTKYHPHLHPAWWAGQGEGAVPHPAEPTKTVTTPAEVPLPQVRPASLVEQWGPAKMVQGRHTQEVHESTLFQFHSKAATSATHLCLHKHCTHSFN